MAHSASIPPHSRVIVLSYVGCGGRFQGGHTREEEEDSLCVALRARLLCPKSHSGQAKGCSCVRCMLCPASTRAGANIKSNICALVMRWCAVLASKPASELALIAFCGASIALALDFPPPNPPFARASSLLIPHFSTHYTCARHGHGLRRPARPASSHPALQVTPGPAGSPSSRSLPCVGGFGLPPPATPPPIVAGAQRERAVRGSCHQHVPDRVEGERGDSRDARAQKAVVVTDRAHLPRPAQRRRACAAAAGAAGVGGGSSGCGRAGARDVEELDEL
eukprot:scaffold11651_cov118-Isochrysis_galbana.AAC.8